MYKLTPKENMLRLIKNKDPEYIPYGLESVKSFTHRDAKFYRGNGNLDAQEWTDVFGVKFRIADEGYRDCGYPVYHPLHNLEELDSFPFPDPYEAGIMEAVAEKISCVDRASHLVNMVNPGFMFVRSWLLHGMEDLLADMLMEPGLVEALLDRILAYQEVIIKRSLELKPDIIHFGDDAGTTKALMMSPVIWRSMIKPRLKKITDLCKNGGALVYMHCCGCVEEIIEDIIEIGVDILNPIQAGANDLKLIKSKAEGKLTIFGGIDAHTVATSAVEEVSDLTGRVLAVLGKGGGYIASPDQGLPFPEENIEAIKRVVAEKGRL